MGGSSDDTGNVGPPVTASSDDTGNVGPPVTASIAWATWALFVGLSILLVGAGLFSTAMGVRSGLLHFSNASIGLIGAMYYAGFLVGSRLAVIALGTVGHIRVYSALASLLSAATITVGLTDSPLAWVGLRFVAGLCLAGQYVVAESWLNQLATNDNRGRLLAVYNLASIGAYGLGQILIGPVGAVAVTAFALGAILTSIAVIPVALSEEALPPPIEVSEKVSLGTLAKVVPTGVGSILLVGLAHGALLGLGVIYATRAGLSDSAVGRFVAAPALGAVMLQWPIAAASDELDRRFVGLFAAIGAMGAVVGLYVVGPGGWAGFALMALIGGMSYPLYAIAGAYTNDWVEPDQVVGAASQLVMMYGVGALAGPPITAAVMEAFGNRGYLWAVLVMHGLIAVFLVWRLFAWRSPIVKQPWRQTGIPARLFFVPATVVVMSRRIGQRSVARVRELRQ